MLYMKKNTLVLWYSLRLARNLVCKKALRKNWDCETHITAKKSAMFFEGPLGDSRKYPYPTRGGMNILTPPSLAIGTSKMCYRLCPPNSKIINPSSPPEFLIFSGPLEFLFDCLKFLMSKQQTCTFSPSKKILLTISGQANKQLEFVITIKTVYHSFPF